MMLRVHGDKVIRRRLNVKKSNCEDCKEEIIEDFYGLCGYCGKNQNAFNQRFELEHFAPRKKFPNREHDYSNLVLSCSKCNKHKLQKWVTNDAYMPISGNIGFIDPATEEFDNNIVREDVGNIIGITELGKYMCKELKFDIRPMSLIWKVNKLYELKEKIENNDDIRSLKKYNQADKELKEILNKLVFTYRE